MREMTNPMREALEEIVRLSGHDNLLAEQAGPVVFARMGDIHQHASAALSTEWRPDPRTVEVCAQAVERMPISPMWSGWNRKEAKKARAKAATAIRSLLNHPSAEKA